MLERWSIHWTVRQINLDAYFPRLVEILNTIFFLNPNTLCFEMSYSVLPRAQRSPWFGGTSENIPLSDVVTFHMTAFWERFHFLFCPLQRLLNNLL